MFLLQAGCQVDIDDIKTCLLKHYMNILLATKYTTPMTQAT